MDYTKEDIIEFIRKAYPTFKETDSYIWGDKYVEGGFDMFTIGTQWIHNGKLEDLLGLGIETYRKKIVKSPLYSYMEELEKEEVPEYKGSLDLILNKLQNMTTDEIVEATRYKEENNMSVNTPHSDLREEIRDELSITLERARELLNENMWGYDETRDGYALEVYTAIKKVRDMI